LVIAWTTFALSRPAARVPAQARVRVWAEIDPVILVSFETALTVVAGWSAATSARYRPAPDDPLGDAKIRFGAAEVRVKVNDGVVVALETEVVNSGATVA
jgi:hypothetical protein